MAEQNGPQARQPSNQYPSPHSYPSPQMQSSYTYPPPQGQPSEPYRQSPTASSMPLPPLNLPPLRVIDGQPAQHPAQQVPQQGDPNMQQPVQPMPGYYVPPPGMPHPGQAPPPHLMRYAPIPQDQQRMMSGGRHKKEIKRRTKTGCLTCRKRRIKCDELHPTCRNCQKSKRECLGYDPIFKQQQGPQQLQPAPSASPPPSSSSTPAAASSTPQGYAPAQPGYSPPQHPAYRPAGSAGPTPSSAHPNHAYEYGSAIDPALAGAESASRLPTYGGPPVDSTKRSSSSVKMENKTARQLQVSELFYIDGYPPYDVPPNPDPLTAEKIEEIKSLYINDFAPGLDGIIETTWYTTVGVEKLLSNVPLCQRIAELIKYFTRVTNRNDYESDSRCRATEMKAVWLLLSMCRPSASPTNGANGVNAMTVDLDEVNKRLDIIEHLLTNRILPTNHVMQIRYTADMPPDKINEIDFWKSLGKFVTLRSEDLNARPELDRALAECRNLLSGRENRDVIYSIMVGRHVGARVPEFPDHVHPGPGGEENDHNKLVIAKTFITEQAAFKGTNHPIQRVCDMVIRSWAVR